MDDNWRLVRCGEHDRPKTAKTEIVLDCENIVIGRNVEPKYRLDCANISRQHACLRFCNGTWDITDLRSHNGVFVNGVKITASNRVILKENDIIGFGKPAAKTDDVFVFVLKKNVRAVIKKELPDQSTDVPKHAPPSPDIIQLSDDDDVVVTSAFCKRRRNVPGTSPQHSSVPGAPPSLNGSVAPAVKQEKERIDNDEDSSGHKVFSSRSFAARVASIPPTIEVNRVSTSLPRQTLVIGGGDMTLKREPCEAFGTCEIGTDFLASNQAQHVLSPQTPVNVSVSSPGFIALPATGDSQFVKGSSLIGAGQDLPFRAVGTSIKREELTCNDQPERGLLMCLPTDAPRPIKQDPEETARNEMSVSNMPAFHSHKSGRRNSDCTSPARSKTGMQLKSSSSLCQQEDHRERANEATSNAEVLPEGREVPHMHAGEALGAQAVGLCTKPKVVESMPFDKAKNTMPKETSKLTAVSDTQLQNVFSVDSSCAVRDRSAKSHAAVREHETENHRNTLHSEHEIYRQGSSTALNETEHISSKRPILHSLSILVKPCSVVVEKLESVLGKTNFLDGRRNVEMEDSSEDDHDLHSTGSPEMPFSQEDQIITISSDSEDGADPVADFQIKREPGDTDKTISNGADFDDNILWANQCPSNLPEERRDFVPPPTNEDRDLEKRLVWNDSEQGTPADERQPENDFYPEQGTSADGRQPENDFFPILSQSFDDEPVPAKKKKNSAVLEAPSSLPSTSTHTRKTHCGNKLSRSPKKKASLKASVIKLMKKNRIPITDFKKKSSDVLQEPSGAEEPEKDRNKPNLKTRFKSRTAFLVDIHNDAKNVLKRRKPSPTSTVNAVHPPSRDQACCRSSARVESVKHSLVEEVACTSRANSPPESVFQVQSEQCSTVPSFKKFVRISRVSKPSPVPMTTLVSTEQNGVPTSPLSVVPCGSPPIEKMDAELVPEVHNQVPAALSAIPPGSSPIIERMEVDSTARDEEASTGLPPQPSFGSPSTESMDVEMKRHVRFHITEPSKKTDEERAEFTQRVRASLKKRKLESCQKSKANLGAFITFILGWKVPWLKEQQVSSTLPPLLDMDKFRSKRIMYSSLEEYKLVHFQFLCLEVWQSVFRSWKEYFALTSRMTFSCAVEGDVCVTGDGTILPCVVLVTQEQIHRSLYPAEGHLVRLDLRLKEQRNAAMPVFGFVMQHRFNRNYPVIKAAVPLCLQKSYVDGSIQVALKIQVRTRPLMLDFTKAQRLSVVSKITPTLRQMEAVSELEQSMFVQTIVRPNTHHFWFRKGQPLRADIERAFSKEQQEVISSAVAATRAPGSDTRIVILHGPPGTGKTHTIIGMVTELLRSSSKQPMLIVAPSNTAVDEIARRLLAHRAWQAKHAAPGDTILKAVRVGQDNMVHSDVRGICLSELLHKNIQREEAEHCRELDLVITGLKKQMRHFEEKKRQLISSACPDAKALRRTEFELEQLQAQVLKVEESKGKRRHFGGGGRQPRTMNERKLAILRGAHVVLSTINSCRSRLLEEAFGRTSRCTFSCVLVDEATQCTEVEALLCLQYRTSKLILVGDPMQLPATVLSQEAVEHGFQESLFERFYNYLKCEVGSKPIFALNEQRRMHSEICQFPSKNFYDGKLKPIAGLDEAYASFPLNPYLVFNIADSPAEACEDSGTSWLNRGEAAFVARLCRAIFDIVGVDLSLGVITPYQAQKSAIIEQLHQLLPRGRLAFDVNTVDSFQGQERDVIVMSCVRAHHPKGRIGFVADARRLNVAITRAKKALFICGHLDSLKDTKEWGALVSDAKDRSRVWDVSANCSSDMLADTIRKPCSFGGV